MKFRDEEALIATTALLSGETQRARWSKMAKLNGKSSYLGCNRASDREKMAGFEKREPGTHYRLSQVSQCKTEKIKKRRVMNYISRSMSFVKRSYTFK